MTSEAKNRDRRNTVLAAVIGTVLAGYAGSAAALDFEFDNGTTVNWNTTLSFGASWRANDPNRLLYTRADGSLIGKYSGVPLSPGQAVGPGDGLAGNHAGDIGDLNYAKGDIFSMPFKLISDVEVKNGKFGGLLRIKAWYDEALNNNNVRIGNGANGFNGTRTFGPTTPNCFPGVTLVTNCVPTSAPGQNAWPKGKLSDRGFEAEQKFDNVYLLDAYVYGGFDVGDSNLQVRLGNQVVNWGESVFIQGVNQINPLDVPASRRAGAELKEILLPVWAAYANWGFDFGSVEAFYQLKWNNTSIDGCDTYWSGTHGAVSADPGRCGVVTVISSYLGGAVPGTTAPLIPQLGSEVYGQATGLYVPLVKGVEPSDSGQFGVAFRFPVEAIDTEFGFYAMNIHSRLPVLDLTIGTTPNDIKKKYGQATYNQLQQGGLITATGTWVGGIQTAVPYTVALASLKTGGAIQLKSSSGHFEYPEDLQIYGISAATNLFGWSVSAEASYQGDVPVGVNGNDLLGGMLTGLGPLGARSQAALAQGEGTHLNGWDRFNKTQFQVNTVKTWSAILGAGNVAFVAEVAMQDNNVPDFTKGSIRYGRNSVFGTGSNPSLAAQVPLTGGNTCSPTLVGAPVPIANPTYNSQPMGCKNDGYVTDFSWGYRLRLNADYFNVFGSGVTMTPSLFWSQDVEGVSMDPTFNQGRQTLGLGLKFTYNKKYTLDANYVTYANQTATSGPYDPTFDRDYYSLAASVTF
jgi:hypothetical protein